MGLMQNQNKIVNITNLVWHDIDCSLQTRQLLWLNSVSTKSLLYSKKIQITRLRLEQLVTRFVIRQMSLGHIAGSFTHGGCCPRLKNL